MFIPNGDIASPGRPTIVFEFIVTILAVVILTVFDVTFALKVKLPLPTFNVPLMVSPVFRTALAALFVAVFA
jgi:hypothetical protein